MGYSNGTQWTDALIKEKIMEVVTEKELSRMPSQKECQEFFHDYRLTNAISRRKEWYELAKELGLPIKESDTYFGKKHEQLAQEQLIAMGFEVRRMPQNFPYDLLVNDCVKIDVKASKLYHGTHGNFYSFGIDKPFCTCDIYLLYLLKDSGEASDSLIIPSKCVATNTQISVGEKSSKYYKYRENWQCITSLCDFLDTLA